MEVEDDMSGPKSFYIQWILKDIGNSTSDDRYNSNVYHQQFENMTDIGIYVIAIPEKMMDGEWQANIVSIQDNQGNSKEYSRETSELVSKFDFEVEDIGQDTIPPVVSNVKRITDTVTAPGEFIVQFDVIDNKSGVANMGIGFGYSPANDLSGVHFANAEKIGENTYQAKVKVESPYSKFVVVAKKQISEQVKS